MTKQVREILVIDDDAEIRVMLAKILENSGFRVHLAQKVDEAFELATRRVPHLVLLDLMLGQEWGYTYLERHRKEKALANVPVMVLSSLRQKEAVYQAVSLGAVDYVAKPVEPAMLVQKIRKSLKERQFPVVKLDSSPQSQVAVRANGQILRANENGFILEAPLRMAEDTPVRVSSPLLRNLACDTCVMRRTRLIATPGQVGQYLNEIAVIGLSPATAQRIRKLVREWA